MGHTFSCLSNVTKLLFFSITMDINTFHVNGIGQNRLDQISSLDFIVTSITMLETKRPWFCVVIFFLNFKKKFQLKYKFGPLLY
jgi:hypothetical protein